MWDEGAAVGGPFPFQSDGPTLILLDVTWAGEGREVELGIEWFPAA